MDSKRECIEAVNALFAEKKAKNENLRLTRLSEITARFPEIKEIDSALKKNVSECMEFMMSRGRDEKKMLSYRERSRALQERRAKILREGGYPENYTDPIYDCPVCKDTGSVGLENCECYKRELSLEYLKRSKIAPEMKKLSFKDFKLDYYSKDKQCETGQSQYETAKTILAFSKKYVSDFNKKKINLLFHGSPGCGKTFLSCLIGTELIKRGNFVIYTSLQDLLDVFEREKFGREKSSESDADVFLDCDFLIIDDLGAEFQSSFSTSCLYHVINSRINRKSPFIISTNLSLKEIESSYDARLSSRIVYETVNIPFPKVDIRLERKKK